MNRMVAVNLLAACVLDRILGDPRWLPHPVRWMGAVIGRCDVMARKLCASSNGQRAMGVLLAAFLPGVSFGVSWWALEAAGRVHPWFGTLLWIVLGYTTLAAKDLAVHAWTVYDRLQAGSLSDARRAVSCIVGRDAGQLSESDVARATIETVAESTSDGVIAPLLYLVLGGPPLALAYKAVNTLDSMIGHPEEPYRDIGWASAKLDDLANWAPARLSAVLLVISAGFRFHRAGETWRIYRRDRFKHASPNSGHPEAAMAGALRVQLGGPNSYDGIPVDRPRIGESHNFAHPRHIPMAIELMWLAFGLAVVLGVFVTFLWNSA